MKFLAYGVACALTLSSAQVCGADLPMMKPAAQSPVSRPSISVGGEAEDHVKPDLAILSLWAVDEKPTAAAAAIENARLSKDLVASIKKFGIDTPDILAENLELQPQYRTRTDPKTGEELERIFIGYRAFTMYRVTIHNVDDAPRIARQIVEDGSNIYRGLEFLVNDRDQRFDDLRAKAVANALQRATLYAGSASLKLGDIIQIAPGGVYLPGHSDEDLPAGKGADAKPALSIPAEANLQTLRAQVTVTWELALQHAADCATDKEQK
jgi:uncharacterized protein